MDKSNVQLVTDVMSSDDPPTSSSSKCSDTDDTIVSHDDVILTSLLDESENISRTITNLLNDSDPEEKISSSKHWRSSSPSSSSLLMNSNKLLDPSSVSGYFSTECSQAQNPTVLTRGSPHVDSENKVLVQTLQDALTWRTMELTDREKEYRDLKANYETMGCQMDIMNTSQSALRSQITLKNKEIKQLQQKINSLEGLSPQRDFQQIQLELEKTRSKLQEMKEFSESRNDEFANEVQMKEEIIERLHNELSNACRQRPLEIEHVLREKSAQWERAIKSKDEQMQALKQQTSQFENIIKDLHKNQENNAAVMQELEEEIQFLKDQLENANNKNVALNEILENSKRFYDEFKDNAELVMKSDVNTIERMKQEYREMERKHRECLASLTHQGDSNSQLIKEVKSLNEKMRIIEAQKIEFEKRVHSLSLEKTHANQTIDELREQLVEASIVESRLNKSFQNQAGSKQMQIDQLSQEVIHLNHSIDDLKDKLKNKDATIERLNDQMVDSVESNEKNLLAIKSLEDKINCLCHRERMLENQLKDRNDDLNAKELDLKSARNQNDSLESELHRIKVEKNDIERSLKRKEEIFNDEINQKDDASQALKSELTKLTAILKNEREINQRLSLDNETHLKDLSNMTMRLSQFSDDLEDKTTCVESMAEKEKRLQNHNRYLEEQLAQVKLALDDTTQELQRSKNSKNYNENALEMLRNEARMQQENNVNLIHKIEQRDQLLQRLTAETSKLKLKYQDRQANISKLTKENESLKSASQEAENYFKDLQQKFDNNTKKKEMLIDQLRMELIDVKNNYSQCFETLSRKEEQLNHYQLLEKEQSIKVSELQKEMSRRLSDYDEMENELNIIRAKYRACQEELKNRDGQVLELKNELQVLQQDTYELQSERMAYHHETDQWKKKCSELQMDLDKYISQTEMLDQQLCDKDNVNDDLQTQLLIANQKIEINEKEIDQLKTDISLGQSTHNDRYNHFQSIIASLKNEITDRRQEYQLIEEKCSNYKSQMTKLKSDHEQSQQLLASARNEIEAMNEKLKTKDIECQHWIEQTQSAQYLNEEVKISLDSLEKEIILVRQQLDTKEAKLHSNAESIIKLKAERNQNYKNFLDCKCQLDCVSKDREELARIQQEIEVKLRKYEQCMKDMTDELSNAQVEISNYTNHISKLESELRFVTHSESNKQGLIEDMEAKISKMKANHNIYRSQFKTNENEVNNLNSLLLQQTRRCSELETSLEKLKSESDNLLAEKDKNDSKTSQYQKNLEETIKELENIIQAKEEKLSYFEDKQQKYQHEIRKLKSFSKQAEEDIVLHHKTIDELQNELQCKQNQLGSLAKTCEALERQLDGKNREVNLLEQKLIDTENEMRGFRSSRDSESDRQSYLQKEIENLQSDLKDKTNKIFEMTVECTRYQTKCSNLEEQLRRAERKAVKFESECKTLRSSFSGYNKEMTDLRSQQHNQVEIMEKTKNQYEKFLNDFNTLKHEMKQEKKLNSQFITETENLKIQLQGRVQHQHLLEGQIEEQESIINQLHGEILQERKKNEDLQRIEFEKERTIQSIENETETLTQTKSELQLKLRDRENIAKVRQQELELSNKKIQQLTESLMERENKLKITEKRFQMSENEVRILRENLARMEALATSIDSDRNVINTHLQGDINQKEIEQLRSEFYHIRNENCQLKIACQAKEDDIRRLMKEREHFQTNNHEFDSLNKRTKSFEDENAILQRKIRQLQVDLEERDRLLLANHDESVKKLTQRLMKFQNEEMEYENKLKQLQVELDLRNEKVLVAATKCEKLSLENSSLIGELKQYSERIRILKSEKESIVDNFNSWIQEQKLANEKLGDKIKDQNKIIQELRREKSGLEREKIKYLHNMKNQQDNQQTTTEMDNARQQLQRSLDEKCHMIEHLQEKLFHHNNEEAHLRDQIITLQKCHQKTVKELEDALSYADSGRDDGKNGPGHVRFVRKQTTKEDESGSYDKQYWIKRVGELSEELQKTREYWSNKLKEISNNLDSSSIADETVSTMTP